MKKIIVAALLLASVGFSTISCNNSEMAMTQSAV